MKLNFCTLFNINYLAKGIVLHESLINTCPDFHLYIFAFDDLSFHILRDKNLSHTTIVSLGEFESEALLAVKNSRSVAEYCWTCTPFTIKYCLENFGLDACTYLDADVCFYKDPALLISTMGDKSVLITPHNYYSKYDQSAVSGIYCVQFLTVKNTADGLRVLNWWSAACLDWCYARYEDGKMGDQKYLDSWPFMFPGVFICKDLNAGVAPWNAIGFDTENKVNDIIFYHFHDLQFISDGSCFTGGYELPNVVIDKIYRPYIKLLRAENEKNPRVDVINVKAKELFTMLTFKYKIGIYLYDIRAAGKAFLRALFFIDRKRFYKNNFIK